MDGGCRRTASGLTLYMSDAELLRELRMARNPRAHIRVLAELNDCGYRDMFAYLRELVRADTSSFRYPEWLTKDRIHRALPKCAVCYTALPPGYTYHLCDKCRSEQAARARNVWQSRRTARLCTRCAQPLPDGYPGQTCPSCRAANAKAKKQRRDALLAAGLCSQCGSRAADNGYTSCRACRERKRERRQRQKQREERQMYEDSTN